MAFPFLPAFLQRLTGQPVPLAWLQLTYDKGKFLISSLGIASAIVLMFVQFGFLDTLLQSNTVFHRHLQADLVLLHSQSETLYALRSFSRRRLYRLLGQEGIAAVHTLYNSAGAFRNLKTGRTKTIETYGVDPQSQLWAFPDLKDKLALIQLPNTVLFDSGSRPEYGIDIDDFRAGQEIPIEVNGKQVKVVDLVSFIGPSFGLNGSLIMSDRTFGTLFPDLQYPEQIRLGLIDLKVGADPAAIVAQIQPSLPADVKLMTLEQFIAFEQRYWDENTAIGFVFQMGAIVGFLIGMYIVYQVLFTDIVEHIPDYAILKAKGYADIYFLRIVFQESLILSVSSYVPGYLLSILFYYLVRLGSNLPLIMTLSRAVLVLGLTVVMSCIAGFLVARKLKESDPADLF